MLFKSIKKNPNPEEIQKNPKQDVGMPIYLKNLEETNFAGSNLGGNSRVKLLKNSDFEFLQRSQRKAQGLRFSFLNRLQNINRSNFCESKNLTLSDQYFNQNLIQGRAFRKIVFQNSQLVMSNQEPLCLNNGLKLIVASYIQADVQRTLQALHLFFQKLTLYFCTRLHLNFKMDVFQKQGYLWPKDLTFQTLNLDALKKIDMPYNNACQKKVYLANDRVLIKSIKLLNSNNLLRHSRGLTLSTKIYTVIRSPHVFKKTREQFGFTKLKYESQVSVHLPKTTLKILLNYIMLLKLPAEIKLVVTS